MEAPSDVPPLIEHYNLAWDVDDSERKADIRDARHAGKVASRERVRGAAVCEVLLLFLERFGRVTERIRPFQALRSFRIMRQAVFPVKRPSRSLSR